MPPVEALDRLRGDEGILERARTNPRWAVGIAAAVILVIAWIGWAIYVTSSDGARAGLGVVIAWPAMLVALVLISLPFIGGYLLIRRLSDGEGSTAEAEETAEDDDAEEDSADEDSDDEGSEEEGSEEEEGDEDSDEDEDEDDSEDDEEESEKD